MKTSTQQSLKDSFDREGYIYISQILNPEESNELNQKLEQFIHEIVPSMPPERALYEEQNNIASLKQLFHLSDYDPYFDKLLNTGKLKNLAEVLLGEKIAKSVVEYFNKPPGIGKATPPHQDAYYFMLTPPQAITIWLPLEDVDEETGCLRYIKGSHQKGMRPHGRTSTLGFSQGITDFNLEEEQQNEVVLPVKKGDVLVHHSMTIHRADGNQSLVRSRRVLGFVYFGESAKEDVEAKKAYQELLNQEAKNNS